MSSDSAITVANVETALRTGFLPNAPRDRPLRREDAQKVRELVPMLQEIARCRSRSSRTTLVDACAGKSALGILALALIDQSAPHRMRVSALDREPRFRERAVEAARLLGVGERFSYAVADVASVALGGDEGDWPRDALVVALHACGAASDATIDAAIARDARAIFLVPCCYAGGPRHDHSDVEVPAQALADRWRARVPLPEHGLVGRRFAQSIIDAERTLRLEASGYETEVVEVFAPTLSPYNLLWRARRVKEPVRMARAREKLAALASGESGASG